MPGEKRRKLRTLGLVRQKSRYHGWVRRLQRREEVWEGWQDSVLKDRRPRECLGVQEKTGY